MATGRDAVLPKGEYQKAALRKANRSNRADYETLIHHSLGDGIWFLLLWPCTAPSPGDRHLMRSSILMQLAR